MIWRKGSWGVLCNSLQSPSNNAQYYNALHVGVLDDERSWTTQQIDLQFQARGVRCIEVHTSRVRRRFGNTQCSMFCKYRLLHSPQLP